MPSPFCLNKKRKIIDDDDQAKSEPKRKRNVIDVKTKLEILNQAENLSTTELSTRFNLPLSTISTILNSKSKKKLELFGDNLKSEKSIVNVKHMKSSTYPDIEKALDLWFAETKKIIFYALKISFMLFFML